MIIKDAAYHRAWRQNSATWREKERARHALRYQNPDERQKRRARAMVQRAIARGDIIVQPCTICGAKAEAHHDDYTKPLDVRWLCPLHHNQHHESERAENRGSRSAQ